MERIALKEIMIIENCFHPLLITHLKTNLPMKGILKMIISYSKLAYFLLKIKSLHQLLTNLWWLDKYKPRPLKVDITPNNSRIFLHKQWVRKCIWRIESKSNNSSKWKERHLNKNGEIQWSRCFTNWMTMPCLKLSQKTDWEW
jgi:hypothetical protein